jgi:hypothetical protein
MGISDFAKQLILPTSIGVVMFLGGYMTNEAVKVREGKQYDSRLESMAMVPVDVVLKAGHKYMAINDGIINELRQPIIGETPAADDNFLMQGAYIARKAAGNTTAYGLLFVLQGLMVQGAFYQLYHRRAFKTRITSN